MDRVRDVDGGTPTAQLRLEMPRSLQSSTAVVRTAETLAQECKIMDDLYARLPDVKVSDRDLIWNIDLIETLGLQNLLMNAVGTIHSAEPPTESRGAHSRDEYPDRDDKEWRKHTLSWIRPHDKPDITTRGRGICKFVDSLYPLVLNARRMNEDGPTMARTKWMVFSCADCVRPGRSKLWRGAM
jgi:succinate dehydrogenase / fumarate reductase, flavoprotein subunit